MYLKLSKKTLSYLLGLCLFSLNSTQVFSASNLLEFYTKAEESLNAQNYYDAAENYKQALSINPNYVDARLGLAYTYFYLGEYQETIIQLDAYEKLASNTESSTLRARSLVALGKKDDASTIFKDVLKKQPNNLEAQFGLAEISILNGKPDDAIRTITILLSLIPDNRRALLSLATLYDDKFNYDKGEKYFNQALYYHPYDPLVLAMNAKHYKRVGNYAKALEFYDVLESISPFYIGLADGKADVLMAMGKYSEAGDVLEKQIAKKDRNNPKTWSSLAYIFEKQNMFEDALNCYNQALTLDQNDEITRFAVEDLVRKNYPIDSEERDYYAKERMKVGDKFKSNFNYPRALREYRQALMIAPENADVRFAFAKMVYKNGGVQTFIDQLTLLKNNGTASSAMLDALEAVSVRAENNLAKRYGIGNGPKDPSIKLILFTLKGQSILNRIGSGDLIDKAFYTYISKYPRFKIMPSSEQNNFTDAWRVARDSGSDFFIVNKYIEKDRVLFTSSNVYLTATGTLIANFNTNRASESKIDESLDLISDRISDLLPVKGYIIKRDLSKAVITLGMFNNIKKDDKFLIIRSKSTNFISKEPYLEFFSENDLGTLTISEVDEFISEGIITSKKIPDVVGVNDEVFLVKPEKPEAVAAEELGGIPDDFMKIH